MAEIINGVRKGLLISEENDKAVLNTMSHFLGLTTPIHPSYNTLVNMCIELAKPQLDEIAEKIKTDGTIPQIVEKYIPKKVES